MRKQVLRKRYILLFISGAFVITGAVFFLRPAAVLVTDELFVSLYGERRIRLKTMETSLKLFRRVEQVFIGENAGPDMVAFAVEQHRARPYAVLFPYRYIEGALRYKEEFPTIPVYVFGETRQNPHVENISFIEADTQVDLYRAGIAAGVWGGNDEGYVYFFYSDSLPQEERSIFEEGLKSQGYERSPVYISGNQAFFENQNISCAVVRGQGSQLFDANLDIPIILFSWIDPNITTPQVKVVFDDSPWAIFVKALRARKSTEIPSAITILEDRIKEREVLKGLRRIAGNIPKM